MQVISFKNTALFKRGIYLSAAALVAFIATPALLDGNLWRNPLPTAIAVAILCVALVFFFWNTQIHRLAEEVLDCGDHLKVRRGRVEENIPLAQVSAVEVASSGGFHRFTILLRTVSKLGYRIDFLPQASLWSNLAAIKNLAAHLTERARSSAPRAP